MIFVKMGKVNKGKNGKITNRTACQKHQCRCENKVVSSDTEFSKLI